MAHLIYFASNRYLHHVAFSLTYRRRRCRSFDCGITGNLFAAVIRAANGWLSWLLLNTVHNHKFKIRLRRIVLQRLIIQNKD